MAEFKVSLREPIEADIAHFHASQSDPAAAEMEGQPPRDRVSFEAYWRQILQQPMFLKRTILVNGAIVGTIVSLEMDEVREVGYWVAREQWGRGVATQALTLFLEIELTRPLYAFTAPHNVASRRVLEKCGFAPCDHPAPIGPDEEDVEDIVLKLDRGRETA